MDERNGHRSEHPEERADHLLPESASASHSLEEVAAPNRSKQRLGRIIGIGIIVLTVLIVLITLYISTVNPATHDATVGADYIGLSPEVSGQVTDLYVGESSCVQQGTLLVQIDDHDSKTKLASALSDQQDLEAQIRDKQRQINAGHDQAGSSFDKFQNSKIDVGKADDEVASSITDVRKQQAAVDQARAKYRESELTVARYRPLAERQYISRQKFDQYVTERDSDADTLRQQEEGLKSKKITEDSSKKDRRESVIKVDSSRLDYNHDWWSIPTLDTLLAERPSKGASVEQAKRNVERARIVAPVNGCVTALNISRGAYAKEGSPLFTLIDNNSWYITAAYRESELRYIRPGMKAAVTLMSDPHHTLEGTVQSVGNAVTSSDSSSVGGEPGKPGSLPTVDRSMNWVRLASRYPVRIRFTPRDPSTLRIGTTADVRIER